MEKPREYKNTSSSEVVNKSVSFSSSSEENKIFKGFYLIEKIMYWLNLS